MTAFECIVDCGPEEIVEEELSDEFKVWSNPDHWPSGAVPVDGEEVVIDSGVNMVLDVDSALLYSLEINGRLTFKDNNVTEGEEPSNLTLSAGQINIRAGELFIGNETHPFQGDATIMLLGDAEAPSLYIGIGVNAGAKIMVVTGTAKLFGKPRDQLTRLKETCFKGDTSITVGEGLDWVAGDRIVLFATAIQHDHFDYRTIESYDSDTGVVVLTEALDFYHYGKASSTANDYNGVDMRGEVALLNRNVRVVGEDLDTWGGQITVQDVFEETGDFRTGMLLMDSVEVANCSQRGTFNAAIRIENAVTQHHQITNSAIHGSRAWGISLLKSDNIFIENTHVIGARALGTVVQSSNNVTMNKMITANVIRRDEISMNHVMDTEACFSICTAFGGSHACNDVTVTNSIAAGCVYSGFVVAGHDCDDDAD